MDKSENTDLLPWILTGLVLLIMGVAVVSYSPPEPATEASGSQTQNGAITADDDPIARTKQYSRL